MKQFKKGQLPAFHDLYVDRSDIRLKIILGDEYEDVAPFISDQRITEIAPTRLKQKLLMSRLAQEIMRYESMGAAEHADAILRAADGLRQLAALLEELPCLSAFYFVS